MAYISAVENFRRMMLREGPLWLPAELPVTPPVAELIERHAATRDFVAAFKLDFRSVSVSFPDDPAQWRNAFAAIGFALPEKVEIGFAGITHAVPAAADMGASWHLRRLLHPLSVVRTVDQLRALPWPDLSRPRVEHLESQIRRIHDEEGRAVVGELACTVFESAWYLRGMENLFADLADGNGLGDWLLDWFTARSVRAAAELARAGVDVIALGDDVGTQRGMLMSVDFWRRHLKPRLKRVIDSVRANQRQYIFIRYHSDGDIRPIIPELIELGIDILNPVQPECMPADDIVRQYKDALAFWGLVGTQSTMPFGTPHDVRQQVARCAAWARAGASIIVAPTHVLEPDVPWDNIRAFVDAVRAARLR